MITNFQPGLMVWQWHFWACQAESTHTLQQSFGNASMPHEIHVGRTICLLWIWSLGTDLCRRRRASASNIAPHPQEESGLSIYLSVYITYIYIYIYIWGVAVDLRTTRLKPLGQGPFVISHVGPHEGFSVSCCHVCNQQISASRTWTRDPEVYTPNLPTNIVPTNIAWLQLSGKSPMDVRISPL